MAATMPKDLKRSTWSKIKPLLMKKTGLGEALEAYAKKKAEVLKKPRKNQILALQKELEKINAAVKNATTVAQAGKHKDVVESLKGYPGLVAAEAKALMDETAKIAEKIKPGEKPVNLDISWWESRRPLLPLDEDPKLGVKMAYFQDHWDIYGSSNLNDADKTAYTKRVNCLRQMTPGLNQTKAAIEKMISACLDGDHDNTKVALKHYVNLIAAYSARRKQFVAREKAFAQNSPELKKIIHEKLNGDPDY